MPYNKPAFFEIIPSLDDFIAALIPYMEEVNIKNQSMKNRIIIIIGEINTKAGTTIATIHTIPTANTYK